MSIIVYSLLVIIFLVAALGALLWFNAEHPKDGMPVEVFSPVDALRLQVGQQLKVMTYNVQFFAGKNYVFFFDTPDLSGPDTRPSPQDMEETSSKIAQLIAEEAPDVILLQELDDGAKRTDFQDELKILLEKLPPEYCCYTSAFYWKLKFVPHPRVWGASGMKMAIISRYQIASANRFHLPLLPVGIFLQQLVGHRVLLQALFPVTGGSDLAVMCTHLDAFTVGSDVMHRQLDRIEAQFQKLDAAGVPWVLGGDLNLLPPGQYDMIDATHRVYYNSQPELQRLYPKYPIIPKVNDATGGDAKRWFTFWGNDPHLKAPDRTLDYIIHASKLKSRASYVRQEGAERLSDHFPVIVTLEI